MIPGMFASRRYVPRADNIRFGNLSSADVVHIRFTGEPDSARGIPPEPPGSRSFTCNGIIGNHQFHLISHDNSSQ